MFELYLTSLVTILCIILVTVMLRLHRLRFYVMFYLKMDQSILWSHIVKVD